MSWFNDVEVSGGAYVDLNEHVREHRKTAIKLFTDEELKEELRKRENNESKHDGYLAELDIYVDNITVSVDVNDVMYEVDDDDLLEEVKDRDLNIVKEVEPTSPKEIKKLVCWSLGINEYWQDEEILEMLKEKWRLMI